MQLPNHPMLDNRPVIVRPVPPRPKRRLRREPPLVLVAILAICGISHALNQAVHWRSLADVIGPDGCDAVQRLMCLAIAGGAVCRIARILRQQSKEQE